MLTCVYILVIIAIHTHTHTTCKKSAIIIQYRKFLVITRMRSFSNKDNIQNELKSGFLFILDYNEDRQVTLDKSSMHVEDKGLISRMMKSDGYQDASIYLNTIGQLRE